MTNLATKKDFLSYLTVCYDIPETELTRSAEQTICSFEGKLLDRKASINYFSCCYCAFFFSATDSVFTTATSAPSNRDTPVFNVSIKKKKIVF